jgi:hypothetical protein
MPCSVSETSKEVGVYETTIFGCLEKQRTRLTTHRESSPLWDPQGSFPNGGDDEVQMVGQGLGRRIEAALEWHTDYARDEECILYYLS